MGLGFGRLRLDCLELWSQFCREYHRKHESTLYTMNFFIHVRNSYCTDTKCPTRAWTSWATPRALRTFWGESSEAPLGFYRETVNEVYSEEPLYEDMYINRRFASW